MRHENAISPPEERTTTAEQDAYAPVFARLQPPKATSLAEERRWRKERLAGGLRIFAALAVRRGRRRSHHRARPRIRRHVLGQSFWDGLRPDPRLGPHPGERARRGRRRLRPARMFPPSRSTRRSMPRGRTWSRRRTPTRSTARRGRRSERLIDPITQDACAFFEDHVFFDDTKVLITETSEGALLAQALGGGKAAILRNHGHITVGRTIDEAVWWFVSMERCCQAQFLAESVSTPLQIDPENARATRLRRTVRQRSDGSSASRSGKRSFGSSRTCSIEPRGSSPDWGPRQMADTEALAPSRPRAIESAASIFQQEWRRYPEDRRGELPLPSGGLCAPAPNADRGHRPAVPSSGPRLRGRVGVGRSVEGHADRPLQRRRSSPGHFVSMLHEKPAEKRASPFRQAPGRP